MDPKRTIIMSYASNVDVTNVIIILSLLAINIVLVRDRFWLTLETIR